MSTQLLIDGSHKDQVQVALVEDQKLEILNLSQNQKNILKAIYI